MDACAHTKSDRKVRFTLPSDDKLDRQPTFKGRLITQKKLPIVADGVRSQRTDERKMHGTARYINGTLNFAPTDYKAIPNQPSKSSSADEPYRFKPKLLPSCLSMAKKKHVEEHVSSHETLTRSPTTNSFDGLAKDNSKTLPAASQPLNKRNDATSKKPKANKQQSPRRRFIFFSPSFMKRKQPVLCFMTGRRKRKITDRIPNTLQLPAFTGMQKLRYHLYTNHEDSHHNAINRQLKQLHLQQTEATDDRQSLLIVDGPTGDDDVDGANNSNNDADEADSDSTTSTDTGAAKQQSPATAALKLKYSRDNSLYSFHDFVQRWRRVQIKSLAKVNQWKWKHSTAVDSRGYKKSDV